MYWRGATRRRRAGGCWPASWCGATRCCCRRWRRPGWLPESFVDDGPVRGRAARALRAVRARRARPGQPRDAVEHARQRRACSSGLSADRPARARRARAGRRRSSTCSRTSEAARTPGSGAARRPSGSCGGCSSGSSGRDGAASALASLRRRAPAPTCRPTPPPTPSSSSTSRRCWPARSGRRPRGSWSRSVVDEEPLAVERGDADPRRDLAGARLQPGAGTQVAAAGGGDRRAARRPTSGSQELDRLKDDFVSTVTHELRTPLTSIRAFSEILSDNPDLDADERAGLPADRRRGDRAADPADQPGARPVQARVRAARVADRAGRPAARCVTTSAQATAQLFRDAAGRPRDATCPSLPPVVRPTGTGRAGDAQPALNAVKFCPTRRPDGCGSGSGSRDGVRTGGRARQRPGIAARTRRSSSRSSGRAATPDRNRPPAPGSACRSAAQIVNHLGGRLWVESRPGQGATFSFTLPVAASAALAGAAETEELMAEQGAHRRRRAEHRHVAASS